MSIASRLESYLESKVIHAISTRSLEVPGLRKAVSTTHNVLKYAAGKFNKVYWVAVQSYPELLVNERLVKLTIKDSIVRNSFTISRMLSSCTSPSMEPSQAIRWYREAYAKVTDWKPLPEKPKEEEKLGSDKFGPVDASRLDPILVATENTTTKQPSKKNKKKKLVVASMKTSTATRAKVVDLDDRPLGMNLSDDDDDSDD